jgi:hypothetical protein
MYGARVRVTYSKRLEAQSQHARNATRCYQSQKMIAASLVSSIDPDLFQNLVWMEKIEGCDDADDVTDTRLDTWTKESLGEAATTATTEDVAAIVLRKVRINMQEKDSGMRIYQLMSDYLHITENKAGRLSRSDPSWLSSTSSPY